MFYNRLPDNVVSSLEALDDSIKEVQVLIKS